MASNSMGGRLLMLAAVLAAAAGSSARSALAGDILAATSSNWAGYAVTAPDGAPAAPFTGVSGAWIQPAATCTPGRSTFSAFWVGLGGDGPASQALEQAGTEADCSANGKVSYRVWYELVPATPVTIKLPLKAGDGIAVSVSVAGKSVSIHVTNVTQKKRTFAKRLTMTSPAPDLSSAEWIAEAPSACTSLGDCRVLPLANFGAMTFVAAKATAGGRIGTISDPGWSATAISLSGGDSGPGSVVTAGLTAAAAPTPLTPDGSSFGLAWSELQPPQPTAAP